jgi:hypothetical protein
MSRRWPCLVVFLLACSGEGDELEAPMLGDCETCDQAPINGGGSSEVPDGGGTEDSGNTNGGDVALPDVLEIVDVANVTVVP